MGKYQPHPAYKDTGVEWLGEIPLDWSLSRIKFASRLNPPKAEIRGLPGDTEVTFLPMEAIGEDGSLDTGRTKNLADVLEGYSYVADGDVMIAKITPCFENGKGAIAVQLRNGLGFATTEVIVVRPYRKPDSRFLYYLLSAEPFRSIAGGSMYGAGGQKRVADSFVANYSSGWPSPNERVQIAAFLDHETAKIDRLIARQERLIELLKEKRNSLVDRATKSSSTRSLRISAVATVVSRPIVRRDDETFRPIGLLNRGRGIFYKEVTFGSDLGDSDFFWIREGDLILSGQFAWEGAISLARKPDDGCVVSHRYPVVRGIPGVLETEYLFAILATEYGDMLLNENSRGAAGRNRPLNISSLMKEKIPVPPIDEQRRVARLVYSEYPLGEAIKRQVALLQEHRTALISAAVTGKIDVRDWQKPDTEPQETATAVCV